MSVLIPELEGVHNFVSGSRTPKYVIRGTRRKVLKKAYSALQTLIAQDNREALRAEKLGYTPLFATGEPSSDDVANVLAVVNRLNNVIHAKG